MVKYGGSIIGKTLMVSIITYIFLESRCSKVFPLLFSAQSDDSVQIKKVEGFRGPNARRLNVKFTIWSRARSNHWATAAASSPAAFFDIYFNSNLAALDERKRQELSEMNSFQHRLHGFKMIIAWFRQIGYVLKGTERIFCPFYEFACVFYC